jgi:hypothetical protein
MSIENKSDAEILAIVNPIMDNLMEASAGIDHAGHTRDFTDRLKAIVTREYLEQVCQKYQTERGFFTKREFVAIFRRPAAVAVVWKQGYTKQQGEFVAEILIVEQDSRFLVDHVMVW